MYQKLLLFCVTIAFTSIIGMAVALSSKPNHTDSDPCHSSLRNCHLHGTSKYGKVQVYNCPNSSNTIICWSSSSIRWVSGWSSQSIPKVLPSQLRISSTNSSQEFCSSVTITQEFPSWNASSLYATCRRYSGDGTSGWYEIGEGFPLPVHKFKPRGRMDLKDLLGDVSDFTAGGTGVVPVATFDGAIAAAAGCSVLLLVLLVFLFKILKKLRKRHDITSEEIELFMHGIAPDKIQAKGIAGLFYLPYDKSLEIPKPDVTFDSTVLGSGAFSQVVTGSYQDRPVAIKTLNKNASNNAENFRSLLGELKVISYLGSHPNLVQLIGAITENVRGREVYLIFEYYSNGNAQKFVRSHRDTFIDLLAGQVSSNPFGGTRMISIFGKFYGAAHLDVSLTTKDLVRWAYEVACAMEFITAKNIYHGDLAARNILLTENLTAKLGNFGLAKQLDMESYNRYVTDENCPLPLRWMAIESLRDLTFSIQSDVWSFGVTLWELFTLVETPYPGVEWNLESWKLLCVGLRLDKPKYASNSVYKLMYSCWKTDPSTRPSFHKLSYLLYTELLKL